jgi:hypothetical protein
MTMATRLVGIDPDTVKSGVATWCTKTKTFIKIECLCFFDLVEFFSENRSLIKEVIIEGGWLIKGNRHLTQIRGGKKYTLNIYEAAQAGNDLGRNKQTGILIGEMLGGFEIPFKIVSPIAPNTWKNDAKMFEKLTGYKGQTNPEKRDAAMLVYNRV